MIKALCDDMGNCLLLPVPVHANSTNNNAIATRIKDASKNKRKVLYALL